MKQKATYLKRFFLMPFEFGIFCFVHHSHATSAEVFEDFVMGDGLADHGCNPIFFINS
jgi:hypothetical protein